MASLLNTSKDDVEFHRALMHIPDGLRLELLQKIGDGETSRAVVHAVAHFAQDEQRGAFEVMNSIGARAAKRWVQCKRNPPTCDDMAWRITQWAAREFPTVSMADLAQAFLLASRDVEEEIGAENPVAARLIVTANAKEANYAKEGGSYEGLVSLLSHSIRW